MTPLLDQVERDFAETELGLSLILEAGAGTGKTRTMVNRLIRSVESGMKIDHLVAITFTVKAAWEMLQRLREELRKSNTSAANEALAALGGARIGTIDSLVQELLTAYPVESGVPAGFHIMSAREFNDRFDVWFTDRYHAWVDEPSLEESWAALLVLDLRPTRLQDTLRQFAQAVLRLPGDANPVAPGREPVDLVRTWREGLLAPAEALIPGTGNLEPNALAYARHLSDAAQLLLADPFIDFSPPQSLGNTGGSNGKTCRDALKLAWESLEERSAPALRYAAIRPLLAVAATDARQFADDLRNAGLLDFDRSLHHVVNMLDGQSEIRDQVSRQLAGVLIDEFQDTSPSQIRFSQLLTGIGEAPLFVVGDPKQSIYRFRGADLNGYLRFRDENTGAMPIRHLICNFRSQSEVLALVDAIFEPVFAADGRNSYYKLVPSSKQDGTVESHAVFSGALLGSAPEVSKKEAELAVQAISTALRERWKVSGEDGPRPIRCGDIAILYRAHKSSPDLEAELTAAGLPYRIESKTTALETSEIRAVRSVLRFLTRTEDDPKETREIARAAALRSLAFGLTDADLLNASRCADAEARLQCLSAQIRDLSPSRAVETIIVECGLTPLAAAARRPRATLNRLRMLLDRAMAFESSGPVELRSFVDALDAEAGERCDESPAPETDEDAVRLMTVHSAKGLEFPMVIVCHRRSKNTHVAGVKFPTW
jgi:ATP-dependent helicase/nuclease subunit A